MNGPAVLVIEDVPQIRATAWACLDALASNPPAVEACSLRAFVWVWEPAARIWLTFLFMESRTQLRRSLLVP